MNDRQTMAEMLGTAFRKAGVLVAVVGTMATTIPGDGFTLRRTAISARSAWRFSRRASQSSNGGVEMLVSRIRCRCV